MGGNGAPVRTRMLTLILLKYLYNVSGACAGVLPPIFGADTRQSRRLPACPRRFSAAHYPPAARESWLARDRLGRGRQIAASGWKTYVGFIVRQPPIVRKTSRWMFAYRTGGHVNVHCSHTQEISDRCKHPIRGDPARIYHVVHSHR